MIKKSTQMSPLYVCVWVHSRNRNRSSSWDNERKRGYSPKNKASSETDTRFQILSADIDFAARVEPLILETHSSYIG